MKITKTGFLSVDQVEKLIINSISVSKNTNLFFKVISKNDFICTYEYFEINSDKVYEVLIKVELTSSDIYNIIEKELKKINVSFQNLKYNLILDEDDIPSFDGYSFTILD